MDQMRASTGTGQPGPFGAPTNSAPIPSPVGAASESSTFAGLTRDAKAATTDGGAGPHVPAPVGPATKVAETAGPSSRRIASRAIEAASNLLIAACAGLLLAAAVSLGSTHFRVDHVWEAIACVVASAVLAAFAPDDSDEETGESA